MAPQRHATGVLGPRQRRWSALLDALPGRIAAVRCWRGWRDPEPGGVGHLHHVPTLVACLAGMVRIERPGERLDLAPGDVLAIAPGVWHRHHRPRAGSVAWMQGFMPGCSDVLCWDEAGSWSGRLPAQPSRLLLDRLIAAPSPAAAGDLVRQVLREDIVACADSAGPAAERMLRAFWSGLHRGVGAADLVRASGLARSRAWQVFTGAYGLPPHQALIDARRALAEGLLAAGMGPGQAARCAGFRDAAAFARARRRDRQAPRRPSAQRDRVPARARS